MKISSVNSSLLNGTETMQKAREAGEGASFSDLVKRIRSSASFQSASVASEKAVERRFRFGFCKYVYERKRQKSASRRSCGKRRSRSRKKRDNRQDEQTLRKIARTRILYR